MGCGQPRGAAVLAALLLLGTACGSDGGPPATDGATVRSRPYESVVEALAADEMQGRDNLTPGSVLAQDVIIDQLNEFAKPLIEGATGPDAFRRTFPDGTNIVGMIPGSDRAEEYVVLGAHYDHIGTGCPSTKPDDDVCNGAGDNAAGVATVLEVGRALADADEPPSRTVILAFWDAEEDGLRGSEAYVADPAVPLESTIAYLNWDIQGVNLAPSVADVTMMVGAETGGRDLVEASKAATAASRLQTLPLSLRFGQGRSDHAVFADAGVPTVFFTDAGSGCYHTAQDEVVVVDFDKLWQEILTAKALAQDLADTDAVPTFVADAPAATFDDAVSMLEVVRQGQEDFSTLQGYEAAGQQFLADLEAMVDAGPDRFGAAAVSTLLSGSAALLDALTTGECDGFLGDP